MRTAGGRLGASELTDADCPMHSSGMKICTQVTHTLGHKAERRRGRTYRQTTDDRGPQQAGPVAGQNKPRQRHAEEQETLSTAFTMPVPVSSSESSTVVMPSP